MKKILTVIGGLFLFFTIGCDSPKFELDQPERADMPFSESVIYYKEKPNSADTPINADGNYQFAIKLGSVAKEDKVIVLNSKDKLDEIIKKYNKFKSADDYLLLPEDNFVVPEKIIKKGKKEVTLDVEIKNYQDLEQGNYILPLNFDVDGNNLLHLIFVRKDSEYVSLSDDNKKPLPPGTYSCDKRKEPMKMVAYVETNDYDIRNMGQFILKDSKKPVFDMVILFAANMNYNAKSGRRVLYFNDKLQPILKDPEKYIKPLTDRGIKVLIDILPNHQGVGYDNFQSYEEALDFAKQCKKYTDKLGIDGWDIDEEYAEYYKLPEKPIVGTQSYFWYMKAMKEVMPDKLLTLYDFGHDISADFVDEDGKKAVDYLDYSWANYLEDHGSRVGLPAERYGKLSTEANWGLYYASYYATQNINDCFGLYMFFNIKGRDIKNGSATEALSKVTEIYYGEECVFSGKYHKGPKDR